MNHRPGDIFVWLGAQDPAYYSCILTLSVDDEHVCYMATTFYGSVAIKYVHDGYSLDHSSWKKF